jgi:phosphohistidine swiveling domain-containing protein
MIELKGTDKLERSTIGGKAYHLNHLLSLGLNVPPTVVLPVGEVPDINEIGSWLEGVLGAGGIWRLAVRSSSNFEDTSRESKAGHYLSLLGEFNRESIVSAIDSVRRSGPRMAVIIQPLMDAAFAGVLFSCEPLSYSRDELAIVWTEGLADRLVSGDEPGNRVHVRKDGAILGGAWPAAAEALQELVSTASMIEKASGGPVDIEWALDRDQRLWFLQSRAVVLPESCEMPLDSESNFARLPALVQEHPKIRLRRQALKAGVTMAPALVECRSGNDAARPGSNILEKFDKAAGVSVVLLHPERVESRIIREFAPVHGSDVNFFARSCRRYSVRRYPRTTGIASAKETVLQTGLTGCWISVAIVQAIWDAYATGIIQRSADGYVIELARGHFVPKGVVPTSTIILSRQHEVMSAAWREQPKAYRFIDGHVLTEELRVQRMCLEDAILKDIATTLDPLLDIYENAALEFGLVERDEDEQVYLIDVAEGDVGGMGLDAQLINSGVLSTGYCRGRAVRVDLSAIGTLDMHLHDRPEASATDGESVVVVAERASVDLLPYVGAPGVVGFIFERGSVLAHLAVVLREKGIPAVALEDHVLFDTVVADSTVEIDASRRDLTTGERIKISGVRDAGSGIFVHQS